ncbi:MULTISPECIES: DUF3566 domain-containing protein [unclassified Streptomyces]|uniref:DUF3566 domain-containing protein n=1 Tax=unclassified Streptomyces TaxID=2593676 RepID=UPI000F6DAC29|nr:MULTISPECIES: DUF3566 domain-containing protein [unclassified Streptomyces]AZM61222.1 hypothetical protein DLM49_18190 [Streptomyces sp. WAC 01438]RSM91014.1 hypothetical protein DMA10_28155 [Streptomyces sp. WAC 01420]
MNGATGAGSAGTSSGTDGGGRGSAAQAADPHTTNLKAIKSPAKDASSSDRQGSQGGTVTDTRGRQQAAPDQGAAARPASPLPGERQPQQQAGPYHPPQAYPAQGGAAAAQTGVVRRPRTGARTTPRVRKARLRVAKADPWSVMKVSFLLSIALGVCTIVASAVLWMVMDAMGVFSTVGGTISEATGSNDSNGFDLQSFLSLPNVLLFTTIIAVIDVVLATALATLGAFIYNLSAGFVGGVELTLAEDE